MGIFNFYNPYDIRANTPGAHAEDKTQFKTIWTPMKEEGTYFSSCYVHACFYHRVQTKQKEVCMVLIQ